jgi:phosphate-selective porin OprO and OprP
MKWIAGAAALCLALGGPAVGEESAEDLRREVDALKARVDALEDQEECGVPLRAQWADGLLFQNADRSYEFRIGGRVQQDWAQVVSVDDDLNEAVEGIQGGVETRRARLKVLGTLYERLYYIAQFEFAGGTTAVNELYLKILDLPVLGSLLIGHTLEPLGLDLLTSNRFLQFLERPAVSAFWPGYNAGLMMRRAWLDQRATLAAGVFRDTDPQGKMTSNDGVQFTGRITGLPLYRDSGRALIHLGASASRRMYDGDTVRFRTRPESHLLPYFADTGEIEAEEGDLFGFEFAAVCGPLSFQGEYTAAETSGPNADYGFSGGYAQAGWFLTGESRPYSRSGGTFTRVQPKRMAFHQGGAGAWELAARYSVVDLSDADIDGGELEVATAALNWYLNPTMRVMANYSASDLADVGESQALTTRFQFDF